MISNVFTFQKACKGLLWLLLSLSSVSTLAQTVIILADTPYSDKEKQMLQGSKGSLYQLINQERPSVVMHLGDMKSGGISCTNALLSEHKALLDQVSPGKIIFTPGDNDWTDCDRSSLEHSFDELERLTFLKQLMFQSPPLLNRNLANIESQPAQEENQLWINKRLAVSTLHIVGTSNGWVYIGKSNQQQAIKQANKRDKNNLAWLESIADRAEDFDALIIGFQADIYQSKVINSPACGDLSLKSCDAFAVYRQAFAALAKKINKPILISHGDTGDFCYEKLDNNLWHLNAAGDFRYIDATKVTFNANSPDKPFRVNGLLYPDLPSIGCKN